jgi:hypothetical protein
MNDYAPGELTKKDMSVSREADETRIQAAKKNGIVKDYSLNHRIKISWDLNQEAMRDRMFKLQIDNIEVICDAEEFMRYLRWV